MRVIVDTSVWSLALRRNYKVDNSPYIAVLRELITDGRVALLGAVRQEILSGIRDDYEWICWIPNRIGSGEWCNQTMLRNV